MGNFRTQADVMRTTAGNVDSTSAEVQAELSRLRGVAEGVRGAWVGTAQAAFDQLMNRWDVAAVNLRDALDSIAENIRANATQFENTEADNAQAFTRVGGGASAGLPL